ncbi:MAG: hypothetical protein HYX40_11660 [Sphingobacteriales bacterium]|nr:hypothetical protein [Sphingobacteriales bacterium]
MKEMKDELIQSIQNDLAIILPEKITREELEVKLADHINQLINNNFQQLIYLLYRIDINEGKLKQLLQENPGENAGRMIAQLIIDRQLKKIKTRASFRSNDQIPDDEKW